ncbi:flagellar motor control protein ZomB [Streptomyces deserti]
MTTPTTSLPGRRTPRTRLPAPLAVRRPARLWSTALVAVPTAALFALGYRRRWICDDGLIYLRPVRQILAGNGPVFNVGERAESSTGTLWQWLLALVTWVTGEDPAFLAVGLGLLLSTAGFALALHAACRLYRGARLLLPAGVFVLLAVPPFWSYMTSGLESGLGTFWTGLSWWLLARTRRGQRARAAYGAAFVCGLGPLVRPDLTVVTVCFLAAQWWLLRPSLRGGAGMLGAAGALPLAYEIFRAGYYGVLVPLPGIAKEAGASNWRRGAAYVQETLGPYWMWPALVVLGAVAALVVRRTRGQRQAGDPERAPLAVLLAPFAAGLLLAGYVVRVGGDYMHARMILPALLLLLLPVLVVPATRATAVASALLAVWLCATVSPLRAPFDVRSTPMSFNVRSSDVEGLGDHNPVRTATWVDNWPALPEARGMLDEAVHGPRPTLLYFDAKRRLHAAPMRADSPYHVVMVGRHLGVTGAAAPLDAYVNDAWGLASPIGAHLELERWSWPGHEKFLRNHWVFAEWAVRRPSDADLARAQTSHEAISAARAALQCGRLAELRESVRAPLTPERFWRNLTGAVERTQFRFPRPPVAAERELCGK